MITDTNTVKDLIRDVVGAFVMRPADIVIEAQTAEASTFYQLKGHPEDEPFLIGKGGSHVRALSFLINAIGMARGNVNTFRLYTVREPAHRPGMKKRSVMTHDPEPERLLLVRILEELELAAFAVTVGPGTGPRNNLTFVFSIKVVDLEDYSTLINPPGAHTTDTIVGSIGTLYRAIGRKIGVDFEIAVLKP